MKPIHLFLEYVIQNLVPLNEYADKIVNALVKHYMDQADDYGYDNLTPEQLKKYIKRFDKIKDSVKNREGLELFKQQGGDYEPLIELPKFIQLVTAAADVEAEPESSEEDRYQPDTRPDAVYTSDDGKIAVYRGDREDLCIRFKRQEAPDVPWCITRTSYDAYRLVKDKGFPVFYLAKNETLDATDPLSAVAIQVTDPKLRSDSERYRWTDRINKAGRHNYESLFMNWSDLVDAIPWLNEIPNAKQELKYIPLTPAEKQQVSYGVEKIPLQQWVDKSYQQKVSYLDVRGGGQQYISDKLFNNISDKQFAAKVLPKFPSVAQHVAENPLIISNEYMLENYDKYPKEVQKSIISNATTRGSKLDFNKLKNHEIPFDACLDITDSGGWNTPDEYYYSTKERNAIVGLETDENGDTTLSIYTPDTTKENVKLSERTAKFIQQHPAPSQIPIRNLNGLIKAGAMTPEGIMKNFEDDKKAPVVVKKEEDGDFVLDSRTLGVYKVDNNGFSKAPEDSAVSFDEELDSPVMRKKAASIVTNASQNHTRIPKSIDVTSLSKILAKTPYKDRIIQKQNQSDKIIIATPGEYPIIMAADPNNASGGEGLLFPFEAWSSTGNFDNYPNDNQYNSNAQKQAYITYLKKSNISIQDICLRSLLDDNSSSNIINFLNLKYPLDPNNKLIPVVQGDTVFLINKDRPSENYKRAPNNTRLVSGKLSPTRAQQMLQAAQPQAATQAQLAQRVQQAQAARGDEPAGEEPAAQEPAAGEQPAAPVAAPQGQLTGAQVQEAFTARNINYNTLPNAIRTRITAGGQAVTQIRGDRGAETRNALLGNRGRVTGIIRLTGRSSAIYFITLTSGTNIASIALQPGNYQYVATANNGYQMRSIENLAATLQARNINEEIKGAYVREFLANNPSMVNEVKACTQKYLKEKNMKKPSLNKILAEVLKRVIKEIDPIVEPDIETDTEVDPDDEPIFTPAPGADPAPKMQNNPTPGEKKVLNQIVSRYQELKERKK